MLPSLTSDRAGTAPVALRGESIRTVSVIDRCFGLFGLLFCLAWATAVLAFPAYKGRLSGYVPIAVGMVLGFVSCIPGVRRWFTASLTAAKLGWFLLGVTTVALALRLLAIAYFPSEPVNDHLFFHKYAVRILEGQGYGGLGWPGLPHLGREVHAFYPPGMSLLLTGWYWLTVPTPLAGKLLHALIGTAMVLLVYDIGRRAISETVGRWAAVLAAVFPTLVFYSATLGYEIVLGTVFCAVIDLALVLMTPGRTKWSAVVAIGLLLGFGSLVKPICLLVPAALLVWWLLMGVGRRAVAYTLVVVLLMAAVIAPWTLRNYLVFDRFLPISSNAGYVLYNANNPTATGIHLVVEPLPGETDELAMDRLRRDAALRWMSENPAQVIRLSLIKDTLTWGTASTIMAFVSYDRMPPLEEAACMAVLNTFWAALLIVVVHTTMTTAVWQERKLYLGYLLLAYLFAIYSISEAETRHHIPILGTLIVVAAYGLAGCGRRGTVRSAPGETLTPHLANGVLA